MSIMNGKPCTSRGVSTVLEGVTPRPRTKGSMAWRFLPYEMIQMDASSHEWISGQIWYLHLAVDDASGEVVGAYFDRQETLKGYYNVFYQILTNYGVEGETYTINADGKYELTDAAKELQAKR